MVFKAKGTRTYKMRVVAPSGAEATLSTGCQLKTDADDVERMVREWQGRSPKGKAGERAALLELLVAKSVTLGLAYDHALNGTLDEWLTERDRTAAALAAIVDLHPHVTAWHAEKAKAKKGASSADAYRTQLHSLFPASAPFTLDLFTRREVEARIKALPVQGSTRNRYKAAASSFAKYLVRLDLLDTNFVRDVGGDDFGENDARVVYYERADAKALVDGLDHPLSVVAALAVGFCAEWCAIEALTAADLDLTAGAERAFLRGTKRSHRRRWVPLVDENRWVLPILKMARAGKLGAVKIITGLSETQALRGLQRTARHLKLVAVGEDVFGQHTLHDWRHTHAVQLLRDGYSEQIAASHLGHKNTDQVRKKYGVFLPTREDYAKPKAVETPLQKRTRR